jgi:uncharacterized membrane protein
MEAARSNRWIKRLLIASLAVNLFAGGLFFMRHAMMGPPRHPGELLPRLIADLGSGLAEPDRSALQRTFKAHEGEIADRAAAARSARDAIREAMAHEPFDREALKSSLAEADARDVAMRQTLQQMLLDTATEISPEGRRKLAASRPFQR